MRYALSLLALLLALGAAQAQTPSAPPQTWQVYLALRVGFNGEDRLSFINPLTGQVVTTQVTGERYTPLGDGVLYFDYVAGRAMRVGVDGVPGPHPFISLPAGARRLDWAVSADGAWVAWTVTQGEANALLTRTEIARADGTARRLLLEDGPRDGIRALPIAFSSSNDALYMDAAPDGLARFAAYAQYAGVFRVGLADGSISSLPDEPACYCGAGIGAGRFVRLSVTSDLQGFDVRVYDLATGERANIPASVQVGYSQAGDVLISPDGRYAVYALSQVSAFGTPNQTIQTIFMLIDLVGLTQTPLSDPLSTYVHPIAWTEDNAAVLFSSPQGNGTWKMRLGDKRLLRVAEAAYLGDLRAG